MYRIIIKTKYNVIDWTVEDPDSEEVKEVLSQPYVISYTIEKIKERIREI